MTILSQKPTMIRYVLTDIEGTTTDIAFVHNVLFPYAEKHIADFVRSNTQNEAVQKYIELTQQTILLENKTSATQIALETCIETLIFWIKTDRKHPALKGLQGLLWRSGYENREFTGHIYPDVLPQLRTWREAGICLGIYSSGSVAAQKLLFGFSDFGDINYLFEDNFDTNVGHKQETASYQNIAQQILQKYEILPSEILFLSDIEKELDAANSAGINVVQLVREGTVPSQKYKTVADFSDINYFT